MKILIDENIPLRTVQQLQALGHDLLDIRGTPDQGLGDESLWKMAQREGRLLITTDKGFTQHRDELHHGILIVRLRQPNRKKIHERVMQAIEQFTPEQWPGLLVVMRDVVMSVSRAKAEEQSEEE
jgi:predicted nuclease of predicted toxin-antitoxin system